MTMEWDQIRGIIEVVLIVGGFIVGYVRLSDRADNTQKDLTDFKVDIKEDIKEIKSDIKTILRNK